MQAQILQTFNLGVPKCFLRSFLNTVKISREIPSCSEDIKNSHPGGRSTPLLSRDKELNEKHLQKRRAFHEIRYFH